ncbi:GNAT family N-acetyltransferase [Lederbergia wuyishanensis]|uniref:GNAT superfamily N-acetyltransferase n=1 Tax=Lederbergia wuyishanensis TaxID=1347903 RepID=A0ABU0D6D1_9BACI|nr:GNAT family N-acetyltransferase [Lederbergia wuyishanensis]MCJ8008617.1 GNAT family N-acetyltransferase [Lederbergia wuyishanensis]MDQ0343967.1 GNAT superfamily N-acetyltransferase [Lederbergia wuyishanensis]
MKGYEVKRINNVMNENIYPLVEESKKAGFRFLQKLVSNYSDGSNTFNMPGEALYGVYRQDGVLIAVGGINIDPFSNNPHIGRLRRFYVTEDCRRNGVGTLLLKMLISEAKNHFQIIVLNSTPQADAFYTSFGFTKSDKYPNSTHYLTLKTYS